MRRLLIFAFAASLQSAAVSSRGPEDGAGPAPIDETAPATVRLNNIGELSPNNTLDEELRGAREAAPGQWPATFYSAFGMPSALKSCTSSLVSNNVVLTAAHCVQDKGKIFFELNGRQFEGECRRHPAYNSVPRNKSADYALCLLKTPVVGIYYESITDQSQPVSNGSPVLLTGFGCTQVNGGSDGIFRIGDAKVKSGPFPPSDNYIRVEGDAVVCFGDSGGPAFVVQSGKRRMISVNSLVENAPGSKRSYLSSTFTPEALNFFRKWLQEAAAAGKQARICGLDGVTGGCR